MDLTVARSSANASTSRAAGVQPITRVSKACEPCRVRKTKCDIATKDVCSECSKRNREDECVLREKARPSRTTITVGGGHSNGKKRHRSHSSTRSPSHRSSTQPEDYVYTTRADSYHGPVHTIPDSRPNVSMSSPSVHRGSTGRDRQTSFVSSREPLGSAGKAVRTVERMLERLAKTKYDLDLSLTIPPEHVFSIRPAPRLTLDQIGLAPGNPNSIVRARQWINSHFGAIHHNTPFLQLAQINDIASRFLCSPPHTSPPVEDVGSDEAALLLAVLALGSFRRETWDEQRNSYRDLQPPTPVGAAPFNDSHNDNGINALGAGIGQTSASPESITSLFPAGTVPLALFRLAQDELDELEQPSEAAVQALFLLHSFVSNTSMGRRSRDFVARAIMMAHEIGLNRRLPPGLGLTHGDFGEKNTVSDRAAARRRAVLYLYVYFSDVYLSALDNNPPLIKRHDFSPDVFDPILRPVTPSGLDTPSDSSTSLSAFVDLVRTVGEAMETLHGSERGRLGFWSGSTAEREYESGSATLKMVLGLDGQLDELRERLGPGTFDMKMGVDDNVDPSTRAATAGKLLRQIHYNWVRIALRAPFLDHPLLGHSSLAICAVSALSLLHYHRYVINAGLLNLPWMQLRRITTAIQIVFIAYWRAEITSSTAGTGVTNALMLLAILGTRWKSANSVAHLCIELAERSDLQYQKGTIPGTEQQPASQPPVSFSSGEKSLNVPSAQVVDQVAALLHLSGNNLYGDQITNNAGLAELNRAFLMSGLAAPDQSLSNWMLPVSTADFAWPEPSEDLWDALIGPHG